MINSTVVASGKKLYIIMHAWMYMWYITVIPHLELMHTCAVTARMKALSHAIVAYFKYIYNKNEVHNSYIKL